MLYRELFAISYFQNTDHEDLYVSLSSEINQDGTRILSNAYEFLILWQTIPDRY